MIEQKQQRLQPSTNAANNRDSLFRASSHTNNPSSTAGRNNGYTGGHVQPSSSNVSPHTAAASAWSVGGLFGRQEQPTTQQSQTINIDAMNNVYLGGDSKRSTQPNKGSTG